MRTVHRIIAANLTTTLAFQVMAVLTMFEAIYLESFWAVAVPLAVVVWGGTFILTGRKPLAIKGGGGQ